MSSDLLFLTCPPREVKALVDDVTIRLEAEGSAARVVKYGVLCKNRDGFIVLAVPHPETFSCTMLEHIKQDEDITGYVTLTSDDTKFCPEEAHDDTIQ
ncbi:MAG: hypothetical protein H0U76_00205 [Ktedonobacteraceae bacterium]|nr:hypothetical protein [Ktedonobacteraceae bacterium]